MKKLLILTIIAFIFLLTACGGGVDESSSMPSKSSGSESSDLEVSTEPDYGIYKMMVESYQTAFEQYPQPEFTPYKTEYLYGDDSGDAYVSYNLAYAELIDLDENGILELVLVRVYSKEEDYFYYQDDETFEVQIFSLTDENELYHVGELPLISEGEAGSRYLFERAVIDGKSYIVSGEYPLYVNAFYKRFWEVSEFGSLFPTMQFSIEQNMQTGEYSEYYTNGHSSSEEEYYDEFTFWNSDIEQYVIVGGTQEEMAKTEAKLNETIEFLKNYDDVSGDFGAAAFNDGRILINEGVPVFSHSEEVILEFFKAQVLKDEEAIRAVTEEEYADRIISTIEEDSFIPGYIIHSMKQLNPEDYGKETIMMLEDFLAEYYDAESTLYDLHDFEIVRVWIDEVRDFTVSTAAPQIGFDSYRYWVVVGTDDDGESWKVHTILTDKFHDYNPRYGDDPIQALFLGSTFEIGEAGDVPLSNLAYDLGLDLYLSEEEISAVTYQNFGGYENYLIKSSWDSREIYIYRNSVGENGEDVRGELLYTMAPGEILMLTCNESDLFSNIEIVYEGHYTYQYSFYPFISLMDGSLVYGSYADTFPMIMDIGW